MTTGMRIAVSLASLLLAAPHLLAGVPCLHGLLFLTIGFDLRGISGHPTHGNPADEAPFMTAMDRLRQASLRIGVLIGGLIMLLAVLLVYDAWSRLSMPPELHRSAANRPTCRPPRPSAAGMIDRSDRLRPC